FEKGATAAEPWEDPRTRAWGLRVPAPIGDRLILSGIRRTAGRALAVSEEQMAEGAGSMARLEGILACPEGGATMAALRRLLEQGVILPSHRTVLFNTGTGLKYLDNPDVPGQG
ncbi:MAG TPA: pyridoxal-phosphate dependent enzyme, partial [Candidatus Polarisedimenticolia bacterium]|nr:pyridoxal-phosphate dependent enzyme [Candidatus Polarisedimenticolia bacterium]